MKKLFLLLMAEEHNKPSYNLTDKYPFIGMTYKKKTRNAPFVRDFAGIIIYCAMLSKLKTCSHGEQLFLKNTFLQWGN